MILPGRGLGGPQPREVLLISAAVQFEDGPPCPDQFLIHHPVISEPDIGQRPAISIERVAGELEPHLHVAVDEALQGGRGAVPSRTLGSFRGIDQQEPHPPTPGTGEGIAIDDADNAAGGWGQGRTGLARPHGRGGEGEDHPDERQRREWHQDLRI